MDKLEEESWGARKRKEGCSPCHCIEMKRETPLQGKNMKEDEEAVVWV